MIIVKSIFDISHKSQNNGARYLKDLPNIKMTYLLTGQKFPKM